MEATTVRCCVERPINLWSALCALRVSGESYRCSGFDLSILSRSGKLGLFYAEYLYDEIKMETHFIEQELCLCKYDAIYNLTPSEPGGLFVVFSGGRCGLLEVFCRAIEGADLECRTLIPCLYSNIAPEATGRVVLLYREGTCQYYSLRTGSLSPEYNDICIKDGMLYCTEINYNSPHPRTLSHSFELHNL